jgi:zinc protease
VIASRTLQPIRGARKHQRRDERAETALRDILREDLGQTYTVSVGLSQGLPQRGNGHIEVSFGASPDNVGPMTDRVMQGDQEVAAGGPSADLTNRAKEAARRSYETALKQNGYWMQRLQSTPCSVRIRPTS